MSRRSDDVRDAARRLAGDLVLRAGAGTGKTWTLVEVTVHLVAGTTALGKRVPPARLLALTFGEKAAAELRERVRARLAELALAPAPDPALAAAWTARAMPPLGAADWRQAQAQLAGAAITTFHSFAASVLRRHAAAARLDPGFALLDEEQAGALRRRAHERTVLAAIGRPEVQALVRELDFSRGEDGYGRGAVEHLLALAARLDEEGRDARALAGALDDAGDAAARHAEAVRRWREAFAALLATLGARGRRGTPAEGTARQELEAQAGWVRAFLDGLGPDDDPASEPALAAAIKSVARLSRDDVKACKAALADADEALRQAWAGRRSAALAPALVELLGEAEAAYREAKARRRALDFADLLRGARDLLRASPAARAETRARFDAILVDEFQDTNFLQKELLELCRAPGVPRLVVGDPKQSIYEFRGADVSVFGAIEAETAETGGQVLALTESRRGRGPLVALVNRLFARAMQGGARGFEIAFDPEKDALAPVRGAGESDARVWRLAVDDKDAEPAAVAALVRELHGQRVVWDKQDEAAGPRAATWGDIAILLRRFTRLDEHLAALRRLGVPHYVVGGRGFHEAQEIRDLAHALALVDEPDDQLALLGVLRSPLVGLSDASLVAVADLAGPKPGGRPGALSMRALRKAALPDALAPDEAARLRAFLALYERLRRHADRLGAAGLLGALVDAAELRAVLAASPYGEQRLANLEQLLADARAHDAGGEARSRFTRVLREKVDRERSLAAPAQVLGEGDDVVRLMTVHQSKGLEFPVVVVPECGTPERHETPQVAYDREAGLGVRVRGADGALVDSPRSRAALDLRRARGTAESLRLFYVASTRARDLLVLAGHPKRSGTWMAALDGLLDEDDEARALVRLSPVPDAARAGEPARSLAERHPSLDAGAPWPEALPPEAEALAADLGARLAPPATGAATITAPVTELADFADCARRYRLKHELGLEEHAGARESGRRALPVIGAAPAAPPGPDDDLALDLDPLLEPGGLDPLARGTLAHRLLERVDFDTWRREGPAALDALLAAEGHEPPYPDATAEVRGAVASFLVGPFGRELAARAPGTIAREESFVFAPRGGAPGAPRLLLKGQMDLVLFDDDAVTVLDYKMSRAERAADYRFQLAAYAAAARAMWRRPVRVGLVFLLDPAPAPRTTALGDAELDAVEARLAGLAAALGEARRLGAFPGLPFERCRTLDCGYVGRCHERGRAAPPPPPPKPAPAAPRSPRRQLRLGEGVEGW